MPEKLKGQKIRMIAVEPTACPTLTKGPYAYDFGDTAKLAPMVKMFTLGHGFMPPGIHAGGLRYHGMSPIVSLMAKKGLIEAKAVNQTSVFEAGVLFAKTEGILPAPESCHAIKAAIDEAKKNEGNCIVFNLSGHGHFDLYSYDKYLEGKMEDFEYPDDMVNNALKDLPKVG
jgi:tryptophan synthase beta chain